MENIVIVWKENSKGQEKGRRSDYELLNKDSQPPWTSFLERFLASSTMKWVEDYSLFIFEPLHIVQLEICKLVKEFKVKWIFVKVVNFLHHFNNKRTP